MVAIASDSVVPSEKVCRKSVKNLEAVVRQLVRFSEMEPKKRSAHFRGNRKDIFCHIPHPSGHGHLICGAIGFERFDKIAADIFEIDCSLVDRFSREDARKAVIESFVVRVLKEHRNLDIDLARLILTDVIGKARNSLANTVHFLPCVFFQNGGPDEFSVGPVHFMRTRKFLRTQKEALHASLEKGIANHTEKARSANPDANTGTSDAAWFSKYSRNIHARAIRTYRQYPWVAKVAINDCAIEVAEAHAVKSVEAALHLIRLLLGSRVTRKIRRAWSRGDAVRTAGIWADASGEIHVSISSSGMSPVGTENWYEGLTLDGGYLMVLLGSAIRPLANPKPMHHLHQRLLDAIHWFGDAATEAESTSQIIKYTSAIECLIFGEYNRGQSVTFAKRLQAIANVFSTEKSSKTYAEAVMVYKARSELLHGDLSPRSKSAFEIAEIAEELCYLCITALAYMASKVMVVRGNIPAEDWEKLLQEFSDQGESVIAEFKLFAETSN